MRRTGRVVLGEVMEAMTAKIGSLPDNELRILRRRIGELGQTNCWWLEYEMRKPLADYLACEAQQRTILRRGERKHLRAIGKG